MLSFLSFIKAKEEVEALEKKMVQLENELTQTQTNLDTASVNLEEKEKALQNVSSEKRARANRGGAERGTNFEAATGFPV